MLHLYINNRNWCANYQHFTTIATGPSSNHLMPAFFFFLRCQILVFPLLLTVSLFLNNFLGLSISFTTSEQLQIGILVAFIWVTKKWNEAGVLCWYPTYWPRMLMEFCLKHLESCLWLFFIFSAVGSDPEIFSVQWPSIFCNPVIIGKAKNFKIN